VREVSVMFFGGGVIGAGGVEIVVERAEVDCFAVMGDLSDPFVCAFIEMNAGEAGRGIFSFTPVAGIFGMGNYAKLLLSVIEGIAEAVVNEEMVGGVHNLPVQINYFRFKVGGYDGSSGVKIMAIAMDPPFEMIDLIVIVEVQDCEIAETEIDFAKGGAETEQAIKQDGPDNH